MKILDRIALLRAGYTKQEIEKMIEEDAAAAIEIPAPEPEKKEEKEPEKPAEPEVDYKALYEKEKSEKEALQQQNINRDNTKEKKDDQKVLVDIVSSFL